MALSAKMLSSTLRTGDVRVIVMTVPGVHNPIQIGRILPPSGAAGGHTREATPLLFRFDEPHRNLIEPIFT